MHGSILGTLKSAKHLKYMATRAGGEATPLLALKPGAPKVLTTDRTCEKCGKGYSSDRGIRFTPPFLLYCLNGKGIPRNNARVCRMVPDRNGVSGICRAGTLGSPVCMRLV